MLLVLFARGTGAQRRLDSRSVRGRSPARMGALKAPIVAVPMLWPLKLLRSLGAKGEPWMHPIGQQPRAHNLCDHTPCPGGLVMCQAATLTAAAAGSPLYSEGYEILLLNKLVYRNTQCFRR